MPEPYIRIDHIGEHIDAAVQHIIAGDTAAKLRFAVAVKADEAWRLIVRSDEPMPAGVALDFVQDLAGDRAAAHDAILLTMEAWLLELHPAEGLVEWVWLAVKVAQRLRESRLAHAQFDLDHMVGRIVGAGHEYQDEPDDRWLDQEVPGKAEWLGWCAQAASVLSLCRDLCSAAGKRINGAAPPRIDDPSEDRP